MQCVEIGEDESGESLRGRDHAESDVDIVGNDAEIGPLAFPTLPVRLHSYIWPVLGLLALVTL